jgi:hypothetical protein
MRRAGLARLIRVYFFGKQRLAARKFSGTINVMYKRFTIRVVFQIDDDGIVEMMRCLKILKIPKGCKS